MTGLITQLQAYSTDTVAATVTATAAVTVIFPAIVLPTADVRVLKKL